MAQGDEHEVKKKDKTKKKKLKVIPEDQPEVEKKLDNETALKDEQDSEKQAKKKIKKESKLEKKEKKKQKKESAKEIDAEADEEDDQNEKQDSEVLNAKDQTGNDNELSTANEENATSEDPVQYDDKKVFVGGMPYSITEEEIYSFFADCGTIDDIDYATFSDTGKFNGIAFITFKTALAAKKSLTLNGADMNGKWLKIEPCKLKPGQVKSGSKPEYSEPPKKTPGCYSAYIGNLAWNIEKSTLYAFFRDCKIKEIRLCKDKETGEFKGFGHVDFEDDDSLDYAVSLDQEYVSGRPIKISYAVVKEGGNKVSRPSGQEGETGEKDGKNASRKRKKGCFVCGDESHKSFDCPQKSAKSAKGRS